MSDRQDDPNVTPDLGPFADALKKLAPQPAHLSRDALLFEAGKAAAAPRLGGWAWPSTAAAFAGLSFVLCAFLLSNEPTHVQYVDRVVYAPAPVEPQEERFPRVAHTPEPPETKKIETKDEVSEKIKALQVRRDVLRWGVDMLPEPKSSGGGTSQVVEARRLTHWLGIAPGTFALPASLPKKSDKDEEDDK
jgi:hypothetical protein